MPTVNIEKISNGYILTIDGVKTHANDAIELCGFTSTWVMDQVKRVDSIVESMSDAAIRELVKQHSASRMPASVHNPLGQPMRAGDPPWAGSAGWAAGSPINPLKPG